MRKQLLRRELAADDVRPDSFFLERANTFFGQLFRLRFREKLQSNIEWSRSDFENANKRVSASAPNHVAFAQHRDLTLAYWKRHSRRVGEYCTCASKKSRNLNSHGPPARDLFHLVEQLTHRCHVCAGNFENSAVQIWSLDRCSNRSGGVIAPNRLKAVRSDVDHRNCGTCSHHVE